MHRKNKANNYLPKKNIKHNNDHHMHEQTQKMNQIKFASLIP